MNNSEFRDEFDKEPLKNLTKYGISPLDLLLLRALQEGASADTASELIEKKYGYYIPREQAKKKIQKLIDKGVIVADSLDNMRRVVVDPKKLFDYQWYTFIKIQNLHDRPDVLTYTEMYNTLATKAKDFGIVSAVDLVQGEGRNYDFIVRIMTNNKAKFEEFIETLRRQGWVGAVDSKPIHAIEGFAFPKGEIVKTDVINFYNPVLIPDFDEYMRKVEKTKELYDEFLREGSRAKQKRTDRKNTRAEGDIDNESE